MSELPTINRKQLAAFIKDQQTIIAFEQLFQIVATAQNTIEAQKAQILALQKLAGITP